ncbi:MAG: hypothetical protein C4531_06665 [Desulfurivibrio sp.]|jgi:hypothetical protein|nr:MAG: hypothetical protein C4531_06665 [Desulfurivibrio sp.]
MLDVSFLPLSHIAALPLSYEWDDWDPYEVVGEAEEELIDRLAGLSFRAVAAFAIGCAEWVVCRFARVSDDPAPLQYLEACWAYIMSDGFEAPPEMEDEDWKGEVRGAMNLALMTVLNTLYGFEDESPESEAAFADRVALHVLNGDAMYIAWRENVLQRLAAAYRRDEADPFGPVVPREIINPQVVTAAEQAEALVAQFLAKIDVRANPFLLPFDEEE